jgi:hypothetical protein
MLIEDIHIATHNLRINVDKMIDAGDDTRWLGVKQARRSKPWTIRNLRAHVRARARTLMRLVISVIWL